MCCGLCGEVVNKVAGVLGIASSQSRELREVAEGVGREGGSWGIEWAS